MKKIILAIIFITTVFSQNIDVKKQLKKTEDVYQKIQDYEADINITFNLTSIKIPESKGKIYYKKPDKFKFISETFSIFPKTQLIVNPLTILKGDFTPVFIRKDRLDKKSINVIRFIPNTDTSEIVLATFWIEENSNFIYKIESVSRNTGSFTINLSYNNLKYPLPCRIEFSLASTSSKEPKNKNKMDGKIVLNYSNYKINKGIDSKIFSDNKK